MLLEESKAVGEFACRIAVSILEKMSMDNDYEVYYELLDNTPDDSIGYAIIIRPTGEAMDTRVTNVVAKTAVEVAKGIVDGDMPSDIEHTEERERIAMDMFNQIAEDEGIGVRFYAPDSTEIQ